MTTDEELNERGLLDHREHIKDGRWSILPKHIPYRYGSLFFTIRPYTVLEWSYFVDGCRTMKSLNKNTKASKLDMISKRSKLECYEYGESSWKDLIVVAQHKNTKYETLDFIFKKVTKLDISNIPSNTKDGKILRKYRKMILGSLSLHPNYIKGKLVT